jgi:hypothetical protein
VRVLVDGVEHAVCTPAILGSADHNLPSVDMVALAGTAHLGIPGAVVDTEDIPGRHEAA